MSAEKINDHVKLGRRWRPALMSYFLRRVGNHAEAEDLTQEVFVRLLGRNNKITQSSDAYVFQIASNLLRDRARRSQVRADYSEDVGQVDGRGIDPLDPHKMAVGRDALATFVSGLHDLPERTRTIFVLYRIENMTLETIAETYGISKSAVHQQVAKATAFLMKRMRGRR